MDTTIVTMLSKTNNTLKITNKQGKNNIRAKSCRQINALTIESLS